MKLPLRSPLGFGFGFGLGLGVRRYGDRGWCGAPKHVDPMARHVHDMRARRRDGRAARPPHHALLVSARGRRGVVPPPEAAPGWSMVEFGGGGGSSHPRRGLGAQWAGLSPGSGSPTRAARGALRGAGSELGPSQDCRSTTLPHMAGSHTWRGSMDARANGEPSATSARSARASVYGRPRWRSWARISSAARPTESDCERPLLPMS